MSPSTPLRVVAALCVLFAVVAAPLRSAELAPPDFQQVPEVVTPAMLTRLAPHPRVLADANRWDALRKQVETDPVSRDLFALIRARAYQTLGEPPVRYQLIAGNYLVSITIAQARILNLATMYRLTGDALFADAAIATLHGLADQPWAATHFLDHANGAYALALGYDWLYERLTVEEREKFAAKIERQALDPTVRDEQRSAFLWADHNWSQVCNAGLVVSALVLAERNPTRSARVINRAIAWLPRAAAAYAPDGVFPEGPSYWTYGTTHHVLLTSALQSTLGITAGLDEFPGFLPSVYFLNQATGPTGRFFAFGDGRENRAFQAAPLWFARQLKQPQAAAVDLQLLSSLRARWENDVLNEVEAPAARRAQPPRTRDLPLALLWWDPAQVAAAGTNAPASEAPLHWVGRGVQPMAALRSSWTDPRASYLAIKGGTAGHHHAHMDVGSFVLEMGGVRWALDLGMQDYAKVRAGGISHKDHFDLSQDSLRWTIFRNGPDAHNILRFAGKRQQVAGRAELSEVYSTETGAAVDVDLASVYDGQALQVKRTAILHRDLSASVIDTWVAPDSGTTGGAQWLTRADIQVEPGRVILREGGETLHLRLVSPSDVKVTVHDLSAAPNPRIDDENPGLRRIDFQVTGSPGQAIRLEIEARLHTPPRP